MLIRQNNNHYSPKDMKGGLLSFSFTIILAFLQEVIKNENRQHFKHFSLASEVKASRYLVVDYSTWHISPRLTLLLMMLLSMLTSINTSYVSSWCQKDSEVQDLIL